MHIEITVEYSAKNKDYEVPILLGITGKDQTRFVDTLSEARELVEFTYGQGSTVHVKGVS